MDFSGPKTVPSKGGARFVRVVRNYFTRYAHGYCIAHQSAVATALKSFPADGRTDGGPELL